MWPSVSSAHTRGRFRPAAPWPRESNLLPSGTGAHPPRDSCTTDDSTAVMVASACRGRQGCRSTHLRLGCRPPCPRGSLAAPKPERDSGSNQLIAWLRWLEALVSGERRIGRGGGRAFRWVERAAVARRASMPPATVDPGPDLPIRHPGERRHGTARSRPVGGGTAAAECPDAPHPVLG